MRKRLLASFMMIVCLLGLCGLCTAQEVYADDAARFSGTVQLLKEDERTCVLQVEVENVGEDFTGTIRLMLNVTDGSGGCAYDTPLTLPNGGKKQFTLTIPEDTLGESRTRGNGTLFFLDESGKTLSQIPFTNLFGNAGQNVGMGILSDSYDKLTYLDMGGETIDLGQSSLPIKLVELSADEVADALDGLYFLVIDRFDTATLSAETIEAIENWTLDGGWLILGTGEWAPQTMDAFDADFLQMQHGSISEPGSANAASQRVAMGQGYYDELTASGIDFQNMAVAEITSTGSSDYECSFFPGWSGSRGNGSVMVTAVSLSDDEMQKSSADAIRDFYYEGMTSASSYSTYYDDEYSWCIQRSFGMLDHANTTVDFSWLKGVIVIYVVLVGPVLYLLLGRMKKKEWYWVAVPVFGVLFIGMVFVFGQNLRLGTAKMYSVAVQEADGSDETEVNTYFCGYHSGTKPWSVDLTDAYTYAGAALTTFGTGGSATLTASDYHYRIGTGETLSIGMKPASNFENAYLYASGKQAGRGTIETQALVIDQTNQSGTVTNRTDCDFPYLLLRGNDEVVVLSDVKAGQTVDIAKESSAGNFVCQSNASYWEDFYYEFIQNPNSTAGTQIDEALASALFTGVSMISQLSEESADRVIVAGVVRDYDRSTVGSCEEISYGCLYTVAEQEVSDAAN